MRIMARRPTLAVVLALVLGACGLPSPSPAASGTAPELRDVTVGILPIVDVAPIHIAVDEGLFEAEGLNVTTEVVQGGAAAIPALQGGDLHFTYGNWISFLLANQQGIELVAIADGVAAAPGFMEFLAMPDSGLEDNPAGLAGTTIALNTLQNVGEVAVRSTLESAGVDFESVQLVEIPFPDMPATLERGDVDVIWTVEPGVTAAKRDLGAVTVIDSFVGEMNGFPVAGYQATADFVAANPNTVAAFVRALRAAAAMAATDHDLLTRTVQDRNALPAELAGQLSFPEYRADLEVAALERVYALMVEHGFAEEGLDVGRLVWAEPRL